MTGPSCVSCQHVASILVASDASMMRQKNEKAQRRGQMPLPAGRHADPFSRVGNPLPTSLAEGIPITEVSRWLGHKSIEVTHQIYGHLIPSSFDRARTALDATYHKSRC